MMRLLFLCLLLLLLPVTTAVSEDNEGSADGDVDDEDLTTPAVNPHVRGEKPYDTLADKTTGKEETSDQFTLIVVVVAVTALTLSVAAIVTIMLVRRHMQNRQQGIYSVPIEQHHKGV